MYEAVFLSNDHLWWLSSRVQCLKLCTAGKNHMQIGSGLKSQCTHLSYFQPWVNFKCIGYISPFDQFIWTIPLVSHQADTLHVNAQTSFQEDLSSKLSCNLSPADWSDIMSFDPLHCECGFVLWKEMFWSQARGILDNSHYLTIYSLPVICWARSPGVDLPPLMFSTQTAEFNKQAKLTAFLRIWPP